MAANEAVKRFFASAHFAVAGASNIRVKYGYRLVGWYHEHGLPCTPINPHTAEITLFPASAPTSPRAAADTAVATYAAVPSVGSLRSPATTALSVVTRPAATRKILHEAKRAGIRAVWLQPGSFDAEGLAFAKREFEAGIGGEGGAGSEGWCVLVDGEDGIRAAGRTGGGGGGGGGGEASGDGAVGGVEVSTEEQGRSEDGSKL